MLRKIISGGQSGAERAALDAALKNGFKTGGWCVKGRNSADGIIPNQYDLKETGVEDESKKDELNLRDAHGTIILYNGIENTRTHHLIELGKKYNKPCLTINIQNEINEEKDVIMIWLDANRIIHLNITGPEDNHKSEIYNRTLQLINKVLLECKIADEEDYND